MRRDEAKGAARQNLALRLRPAGAGGARGSAGYNHSIRYKNHVVHVQTEDAGARQAAVFTHVFVDGRVVGTRRASYADRLGESDLDASVRRLVYDQHRSTFVALRDGEFDRALEGVAPRDDRASAVVLRAEAVAHAPTSTSPPGPALDSSSTSPPSPALGAPSTSPPRPALGPASISPPRRSPTALPLPPRPGVRTPSLAPLGLGLSLPSLRPPGPGSTAPSRYPSAGPAALSTVPPTTGLRSSSSLPPALGLRSLLTSLPTAERFAPAPAARPSPDGPLAALLASGAPGGPASRRAEAPGPASMPPARGRLLSEQPLAPLPPALRAFEGYRASGVVDLTGGKLLASDGLVGAAALVASLREAIAGHNRALAALAIEDAAGEYLLLGPASCLLFRAVRARPGAYVYVACDQAPADLGAARAALAAAADDVD